MTISGVIRRLIEIRETEGDVEVVTLSEDGTYTEATFSIARVKEYYKHWRLSWVKCCKTGGRCSDVLNVW